MCFAIDFVAVVDFDREVTASMSNSEAFSCASNASRLLWSKEDTSIKSPARSITSFLSDSPKVFREASFVGDFLLSLQTRHPMHPPCAGSCLETTLSLTLTIQD